MSQIEVVRDSLITMERLENPSWLIRGRMHKESLTAPYGWVAVLSEVSKVECEVKGYLAKHRRMTPKEYSILLSLSSSLGYDVGGYDRVDNRGTHKKHRSPPLRD